MKSTRTPGRPSGIGGGSGLPTPRSRSSSVANGERAKTPTFSIPAVPSMPLAAKSARPPSRTSVASSSNAVFTPTINAPVRIESLGFEGILRYLGEIPPKQGIWAGVELSAGFAGKGKNDGSTPDGKRYFESAPMCGVFVSASKLSRATAGLSRPPSVASTAGSESMSGLLSASSSRSGSGIGTGRVTPSARKGRLSLAASTSSNASTSSYSYKPASSSGRVTPSNSLSISTTSIGPETPAARAGRLRALNAGATPLVKTRSQGANVEKAVPVPAVPSIPRAPSASGSSIPSSLPSPTTSNASPRRIPSSNQTTHLSSPFNTPKARGLVHPSSGIGLSSPHGATPRARLPSAVAMPPPPSPNKDPNLKDLTDLQKTTRDIQERIRGLTGETAASPLSPPNTATTNASPPSAASTSYSYSSQSIPSPSRRPQSRIASTTTISSRARSRSRAGSTSVSNSMSTASTQSRPSSVASTASAMSASTRSHVPPRSSTPGFGPRSSTPGFGIGPRSSTPGFGRSLSRAGAETPSVSVDERLERMQSRIAALEYENTRLRDEAEGSTNEGGIGELRMKLRELEKDLENANIQLVAGTTAASNPSLPPPSNTDAEAASSTTSSTVESPSRSTSPSKDPDHKLRQEINLLTLRLDDASTKALSAHARAEQLQSALDSLQSTSDAHVADIKRINEELKQAQTTLEARETELAETKGLYATTRSDLEERTAEIGTLKGSISDVEKKHTDELERNRDMWDVERKELRSQVDELRRAGQETIALYEEKLDEMRLNSKGNNLSTSVSSLSRSRSSTLADEDDLKKDDPLSASSIDHSALLEQLTYLQTKTASLTDALEDARHLHQSDLNILQAQLNQSKTQFKALKGELEERVRTAEMDVGKMEKEVEQERRRRGEIEEALRESGEALEEARREVEGFRMSLGGEDSESKDKSSKDSFQSELTASQADLARATSELKAAKSEISSHKEEIAGLKHLVKELQRLQRDSARDEEGEVSENAVLRRENEVIKEENKMLLREMEALKEEVKVLEEGLSVLEDEEEGKAKRREAMVNGSSPDGNPVLNGVKSIGANVGSGHEVEESKKEIEALKKKLGEMEIKAARKTHDLNKEISDLEALVETKIYREDELEQEIERLNEKLRKANAKRSGKSSSGPSTAGDVSSSSTAHVAAPTSSKHTNSSSIGSTSIKSNGFEESSSSEGGAGEEPVCEICEKPGHDIFSCDLLREDYGHRDMMSSSDNITSHSVTGDEGGDAEGDLDIWCEECEGHGHRAEECPYAGDVF
ncbi:hypothetical protein F5890DRAFT_1524709 [Lentinula detonsa]|uniref:CAP-Gly domain-containing protein n=1 Tax=Lentinula detonsa TaxID=2804962 RepID=A0AA38PX16_9AGAR|nr:hypothetical protein F5890DRAFT_1524709 [Lentinula detonsa]